MYQTQIIAVDPSNPDLAIIEHAASLLQSGEIVVFPTETVYGLGADAFQPQAVERIFTAKGRPFSDPLIVHIADPATLHELTSTISEQVKSLAEAFWPGPLTLILPRNSRVSPLVTAGMDTVAVRMPRHPVALALIRVVGSPIAAPSANRFMHVSPTTARHVYADLNGRVPLILDAGPSQVGVESTVLDLSSDMPTILRPGGISLEDLRRIVPDVQLPTRHNSEESKIQRSPGQLMTHYAPAIPLLLFDGSVENMRSAMVEEVRQRQSNGERAGILIANEDVSAFQDSGAVIYALGSANNAEQIAATLFAGLRTLEDSGVQVILCRNFETHGIGLAIRDRLLRAAGGRIYKSV